MATPSWTGTVRRAAEHPVVRMTAAALLQALASHLTHQGTGRPSCTGACAHPRAHTGRP